MVLAEGTGCCMEGLKLGEAVAIGILKDSKATCTEHFSFTLTTFDGTTITICIPETSHLVPVLY